MLFIIDHFRKMVYIIDEYVYLWLTLSQKYPTYTTEEINYLMKFGISVMPCKIITSIKINKPISTTNESNNLYMPLDCVYDDIFIKFDEYYAINKQWSEQHQYNNNKKYKYVLLIK